ncbi:NUMOD4 motif-containing HNH endonuclease [Agrobacterium deltaense]
MTGIERWKPVVGHEGLYEVSDHGRVRSLPRVSEYDRIDQYSGRTLTIRRRHPGKMLRQGRTSSGHVTVALGRGNSRYVHILVLAAFIGPCPEGFEALHGDDEPGNNMLGNLRWGTRSENVQDAIKNGGYRLGSRHHASKLTEAQVSEIKKRLPVVSADRIASEFGVSGATIRQIRSGRSWKHVEVSA